MSNASDTIMHNAAGPCEPGYHRAMPDGTRCRCGRVRRVTDHGYVYDHRCVHIVNDGTGAHMCGMGERDHLRHVPWPVDLRSLGKGWPEDDSISLVYLVSWLGEIEGCEAAAEYLQDHGAEILEQHAEDMKL